ncbi:MAG: Diacylglycerol kinase [candidate division WS6 bacterium GW2011_GWC2_36_7]|uniref:Diacylglycerol kinase n=1 Tax=candidate division WS6 bacterium GW2011_GWC2_36_7 TaxID=1619091 RepID=A0A0G0F091_9BACT|nr:MAG: Diacylglycerol kinase [candidate division WS6 bacterium GW2011_GWC2_36_7]HAM37341.1 diacylglycerol kinase [Patescibacteria group bacterium]
MKDSFTTSKTYFESQKHAIYGLISIIKNERNFRIQLVVAVFVVLLGILLEISHTAWIAVGFLIALVLIAEAFNSVIEALSDTISQEFRVNIKYAKDVSAGCVLVSAIASVVLGIIIFVPYLIPVLEELLTRI